MLGALVPAMLLATRWVRPSRTGGVGNPTTEEKTLALLKFSDALMLMTHLFSSLKDVAVFECHDISFL